MVICGENETGKTMFLRLFYQIFPSEQLTTENQYAVMNYNDQKASYDHTKF